jgi:hypothetical protein
MVSNWRKEVIQRQKEQSWPVGVTEGNGKGLAVVRKVDLSLKALLLSVKLEG